MEHLFTPWRMEYILSAKKPGCIFCDMLETGDDRELLVLHRGQLAFLVLNKYPYNNGHFMAVPYHHVDTLEDLAPEEMTEIMTLAALGMRALRQASHPDGFNLGVNVGTMAGAGVKDHLHLHVVPRWGGDTNYMSVLSATRVIPQTLADTYDQLKAVVVELAHDG
jgi:ATP adenylyltransferase